MGPLGIQGLLEQRKISWEWPIKNDNYQSRMILQIHDELLFESPKDEISELEKMVKDKMINAMPLEVPLVVDCGQGISWFDAH